jgi:hypothetical protein
MFDTHIPLESTPPDYQPIIGAADGVRNPLTWQYLTEPFQREIKSQMTKDGTLFEVITEHKAAVSEMPRY